MPLSGKPLVRPVSPPLSSVRLSRLIYILLALSILLVSYYSYRLVGLKNEVGGWWNFALGRPAPPTIHSHIIAKGNINQHPPHPSRSSSEETVEDRINALAQALGMPSRDLASAIAVAVREYVPPASLSSVAAQETGDVVDLLVGRTDGEVEFKGAKPAADGGAASSPEHTQRTAAGAARHIVEQVAMGIEEMVGD